MIGYTITGYDVSRIVFASPDDAEDLPKNVKDGSIAIDQADDTTIYVFWKGDWVEVSLE